MSTEHTAHYGISSSSDLESSPLSNESEPETAVSTNNASAALSSNIHRLARALLYLLHLLLLSVQNAPSVVVGGISSATGRRRDSRGSALLPQYSTSDNSTDESSTMSSEEFRNAVITSFLNDEQPSSPASAFLRAADERTPLLSDHSTPLIDHSRRHHRHHPTKDLHILITHSSSPADSALFDPSLHPHSAPSESDSDKALIMEPTPSTDSILPASASNSHTNSPPSSEDSASCSTPSSSSNSSFVLLRSALKKTSSSSFPSSPNALISPSPSTHASPSLAFLRLALPDLLLPHSSTHSQMMSPSGSGRSTPKTVRFNPDGNETHFFEYAPNEEHDPSKSLRAVGESSSKAGGSSAMGKWRKRGSTIIWQDDPNHTRHPRSHPHSPYSDPDEEEEAFSRALFGTSLPGRIFHSLLVLGSRSASVSAGGRYGGTGGSSGVNGGGGSGTWGDEGRWKDGMF